MSLKLSELKALHDKGLALIYLHEKQKRPIEKGWTTSKPKTWAELENSFEKNYNVGVRLGEPSKLKTGMYLGAIDCDVKSADKAARIEMGEKLDEIGIDLGVAPVVMSGRGNGSRHVYVQTKEPMRPMKFAQSKKLVKVKMPGHTGPLSRREKDGLNEKEIKEGYRIRPAWEISFMGTGQQTVLPPSIHPDTGFAYRWSNPFNARALPVFRSENFTADRAVHALEPRGLSDSKESTRSKFQAESVNLYKTKLDVRAIKMIKTGEGVEDRSADLLTLAMKMCRAGLTDNQILSVLSDESNWISGAARDHTKSGRREKWVRWLDRYTLTKARYETSVMRLFERGKDYTKETRSEDEKAADKKELEEEKNQVLPDLDGKMQPKSSLRNIVHVLEHFIGGGLVGFNDFSRRPYFLKDTVYGGKAGRELNDGDDLALKHYLACHYRFEPSKELCFEAHSLVAARYRFHPIKTYLESLTWDGVPRLDSWLIEAFDASGPREYVEAVGRKVLCGAVARLYEPGCKFDYMTVLEGNQGEGKSMSLGMLVGQDWFADSLGDIHNKDVVDQMMGKWLIEVSELDSIRGREAQAVKAFVSRQVDRVRLSYARRTEDYPRQCIFIGSTNDKEYLTDETGNRRYWPIAIGRARRKWIRENRDQLWAEAVYRYELGERLYLSKELEAIANAEQEKRFETDDWEMEIKAIMMKDPDGRPSTTDLWRAVNLSAGNGHPDMLACKRIGKIMRRLKYHRTVKRGADGIRGKCWMKM